MLTKHHEQRKQVSLVWLTDEILHRLTLHMFISSPSCFDMGLCKRFEHQSRDRRKSCTTRRLHTKNPILHKRRVRDEVFPVHIPNQAVPGLSVNNITPIPHINVIFFEGFSHRPPPQNYLRRHNFTQLILSAQLRGAFMSPHCLFLAFKQIKASFGALNLLTSRPPLPPQFSWLDHVAN